MHIRTIQVKNIFTKAKAPHGDFSANPYVGCLHNCKFCFASYMQLYSNHHEAWGTFVDVKYWPPLTNLDRLYNRTICIGTVTDPYQPIEAQYARTRELLTQLQGANCKLLIITRSDLVIRDLDLLATFPQVHIAWSINTLEEGFRVDMDQAVSLERRFQAMQYCKEAGFKTICFIAPIFPVLTNVFNIIDFVRDKCTEVWLDPLNLRTRNLSVILDYIAKTFPQLLPLYQRIYLQKDLSFFDQLSEQIAYFCQVRGLPFNGQTYYPLYSPSPNIVCQFGLFKNSQYSVLAQEASDFSFSQHQQNNALSKDSSTPPKSLTPNGSTENLTAQEVEQDALDNLSLFKNSLS